MRHQGCTHDLKSERWWASHRTLGRMRNGERQGAETRRHAKRRNSRKALRQRRASKRAWVVSPTSWRGHRRTQGGWRCDINDVRDTRERWPGDVRRRIAYMKSTDGPTGQRLDSDLVGQGGHVADLETSRKAGGGGEYASRCGSGAEKNMQGNKLQINIGASQRGGSAASRQVLQVCGSGVGLRSTTRRVACRHAKLDRGQVSLAGVMQGVHSHSATRRGILTLNRLRFARSPSASRVQVEEVLAWHEGLPRPCRECVHRIAFARSPSKTPSL